MRVILFLTLLLSTLGVYSQTQPSLPSGTVPYSTNLYRATDGSIWTGKTGSYTNLGNKQYVDSLSSLGYTNEMIDSIALYNYDRARNRINHTGTQAQSTVVNLVSDLASKENISNKSTTLASPNDTNFPTTKAVSDGLNTKQDSLISGTNIKTINSESLLGSGNISINVDTLTLQEVTTEGNETSKPILLTGDENVPALYSGIEISSVGTIKYDEGVRLSAMVLHQDDGTWSVFKDAGGPSLGIFYVNDGTNITETPYDHIMTNVPFKGVPATELDEFVTLGQLNDSLDNHSGGGSSQNLQQVTTEGNVTDKGIIIAPGSSVSTPNNNVSLQATSSYFSLLRKHGTSPTDSDQIVTLDNDGIYLTSYDDIQTYDASINIKGNEKEISILTTTSDEDPIEPQNITTGFIIDGIDNKILATSRIQGVAGTNANDLVTKSQLEAYIPSQPAYTIVPSGNTLTPNWNYSVNTYYSPGGPSVTYTIDEPTGGTPPDGARVVLRLARDSTDSNIVYNAIFRGIGVSLPATINAGMGSEIIYISMIYNASASKWDVVEVTNADF